MTKKPFLKTPDFDRAKIIATIGPACNTYDILLKMCKAGVDVCRLNFSHGDYKVHQQSIDVIRRINAENGLFVSILQDLQGPKLRVGEVENNLIQLQQGKKIILTTKKCIGTPQKIYINYPSLAKEVKKGERILLDDGKIELAVATTINKNEVEARIIFGGPLSSRKGVNFPHTKLSIKAVTEKDEQDLQFGLKNDVEWVALSFVRSADDIIYIKKLIKDHGSQAKVMAKIEKPEAVHNIAEIIREADAVMVARGDLGVEMELEKVPVLQKEIVLKSLMASKPVVIATQMMESMIESPTPTRAETNDVTNAVMDGADAVMLSAETSVGKYPLKVIETMRKIVSYAGKQNSAYHKQQFIDPNANTYLSDEVCLQACKLADHLGAVAIVALTQSGLTAFKLASFRPKAKIFIFTRREKLILQLSIVWGVKAMYYAQGSSTDQTFHDVNEILKQKGHAQKGDIIINLASMPVHEKGRTNTIKVSVVE
jgi:pyruvate kinase